MYGAGPAFDMLLDRLRDMGSPPPRFGRLGGTHQIWCNATLPKGTVERRGETLDQAAAAILEHDLACPDKDREKAQAKLA